MDDRGFIQDGDKHHLNDLDVFVWKMKMKDKKFKDRFEAIVWARILNNKFGLKKVNDGFSWGIIK